MERSAFISGLLRLMKVTGRSTMAICLENYADLLKKMGRKAEADPLEARPGDSGQARGEKSSEIKLASLKLFLEQQTGCFTPISPIRVTAPVLPVW